MACHSAGYYCASNVSNNARHRTTPTCNLSHTAHEGHTLPSFPVTRGCMRPDALPSSMAFSHWFCRLAQPACPSQHHLQARLSATKPLIFGSGDTSTHLPRRDCRVLSCSGASHETSVDGKLTFNLSVTRQLSLSYPSVMRGSDPSVLRDLVRYLRYLI